MGRTSRFFLRLVENDLYLSFRGSSEAVFSQTEGTFPLTEGLDPYVGPQMNALLDKDGRCHGLVIHKAEEYRHGEPSQPVLPSANKGATEFRLRVSGDKAYLWFPFSQPGRRVHKTIFLSKGPYFRDGVQNPDIILDLNKEGIPEGIEILAHDSPDESV